MVYSSAVQAEVLCGPTNISVGRKAAVVLQKVAEGLSFYCGQYGSFAVLYRFLWISAVLEPRLEPQK